MAEESIEALERAWQDLFRRILAAGREQGERAAFQRILKTIQTAAAEVGAADAPAEPKPAAAAETERQSIVPIRGATREWDPPTGS